MWAGPFSVDSMVDRLFHINSGSLHQESVSPLLTAGLKGRRVPCAVSSLKSSVVCASLGRTGRLWHVVTVAFAYCPGFECSPSSFYVITMAAVSFLAAAFLSESECCCHVQYFRCDLSMLYRTRSCRGLGCRDNYFVQAKCAGTQLCFQCCF